MGTAFAYLVIGSVLFLVSLSNLLHLDFSYIFILWFFGFVMMMIFGLSYMSPVYVSGGKAVAVERRYIDKVLLAVFSI